MNWFFSLLMKVPPLILELSIWIWMLLLLRSHIIISFLFILRLSRVTSMIFFKIPFFVLMSCRLLLFLVSLVSSLFILFLVFVLNLSFWHPSLGRLCITTATSSRCETSTTKKSSTSATSATSITPTIISSVEFFWRGGGGIFFSLGTWLVSFLWNVLLILVFGLRIVFSNLSLLELRHKKI